MPSNRRNADVISGRTRALLNFIVAAVKYAEFQLKQTALTTKYYFVANSLLVFVLKAEK